MGLFGPMVLRLSPEKRCLLHKKKRYYFFSHFNLDFKYPAPITEEELQSVQRPDGSILAKKYTDSTIALLHPRTRAVTAHHLVESSFFFTEIMGIVQAHPTEADMSLAALLSTGSAPDRAEVVYVSRVLLDGKIDTNPLTHWTLHSEKQQMNLVFDVNHYLSHLYPKVYDTRSSLGPKQHYLRVKSKWHMPTPTVIQQAFHNAHVEIAYQLVLKGLENPYYTINAMTLTTGEELVLKDIDASGTNNFPARWVTESEWLIDSGTI